MLNAGGCAGRLFLLVGIAMSLSRAQAETILSLPASALDTFFGDLRGAFFWAGPLSDQAGDGLAHPLRNEQLSDGNHLIAGCISHNCSEGTGAIPDPHGRILAVGLINFHCRAADGGECDQRPGLTVFLSSDDAGGVLARELRAWAGPQESGIWSNQLIESIWGPPPSGLDEAWPAEMMTVVTLPADGKGTIPAEPPQTTLPLRSRWPAAATADNRGS